MLGFLSKTLKAIRGSKTHKPVDKNSIETALLEADVPYEIIEEIIYYLPPSPLVEKSDLERVMGTYFLYPHKIENAPKPLVTLLVGVNGAGKTTTTAKLARLAQKSGKKVLLGAADTFRAGAIEQLKMWGQRLGIQVVAGNSGGDPASVAFDTISSAVAKGCDEAIIDTAGRLQNHKNLSAELEKIARISNKAMQGAPHRKLLILDGTQGQNAINQAKIFNELIKIDGIIITKLDGTARGGFLFGIARELELPICYVGTGESMEDLMVFEPKEYVQSIINALYEE